MEFIQIKHEKMSLSFHRRIIEEKLDYNSQISSVSEREGGR